MSKKPKLSCFLISICLLITVKTGTISAEDYDSDANLKNVITALQILCKGESDKLYDADGNNKVGLAEAVRGLRSIAGESPSVQFQRTKLIGDIYELLVKDYYEPASPAAMLANAVKELESVTGSENLMNSISGSRASVICQQDMTHEEGLQAFYEVYKYVTINNPDYLPKKIIKSIVKGMFRPLDPYCRLLPPEALEELVIDTGGGCCYGGIGVVVTDRDSTLRVISPIEGTPSHKAGIKGGDRIIMIDGKSVEETKLWEAVKNLRGCSETPVTVRISRDKMEETRDVRMIRGITPVKTVHFSVPEPGYGYIRITEFGYNTSDDVEKALKMLESGDVSLKGLILDFRNNPTGLLNEAMSVADIFIAKGAIVSIRGRLTKYTKIFEAHPNTRKDDYPIIILINNGTAGVSEVVAGALRDHGKALILGNNSFGKGAIQTVETIHGGYGLKFTIAHFFTPNGHKIEGNGIVPDIFLDDSSASDEDDLWIRKSLGIFEDQGASTRKLQSF